MKRIILSFIMYVIILYLSINVALASSSENAQDPADKSEDKWYIGPRIGISKFTGVLGIEAQKRHFALTFGVPATGGVKYYFSSHGHSAFMGAFFGKWGFEEDDGRDVERTEAGIGGGYRWRWRNAWDLTFGAAIHYLRREEEKRFSTEIEESVVIVPMLTVGYSF